MNKWKTIPGIFRRRILLTGITGLGCSIVAAVVFFVSKDRILLFLGCGILLICIGKVISYWQCASGGHYHILTGTCNVSKGYAPLRFQKVLLKTETGDVRTLLIDKKAGIRDGCRYRFYFHGEISAQTGNTKLDAAFLSESMIGMEMIESDEISS